MKLEARLNEVLGFSVSLQPSYIITFNCRTEEVNEETQRKTEKIKMELGFGKNPAGHYPFCSLIRWCVIKQSVYYHGN